MDNTHLPIALTDDQGSFQCVTIDERICLLIKPENEQLKCTQNALGETLDGRKNDVREESLQTRTTSFNRTAESFPFPSFTLQSTD